MSSRIQASFVFLALLAAVGCSSDNNTVYPVSGMVNFEGKPMEGGGSIAFIPTEGEEGKAAGGIIDEDGNYTLSTYSQGDGSMAGKFRVVITQSAAEEPESTPDGTAPNMEPTNLLPPDQLIPMVYSDPRASPLSTTVEESKNELNFDLKRDVAAPAGDAPPPQVGA